jgi:hypothetical protein
MLIRRFKFADESASVSRWANLQILFDSLNDRLNQGMILSFEPLPMTLTFLSSKFKELMFKPRKSLIRRPL